MGMYCRDQEVTFFTTIPFGRTQLRREVQRDAPKIRRCGSLRHRGVPNPW